MPRGWAELIRAMSFHRPAFVVAKLGVDVTADELTDKDRLFYLDGDQSLEATDGYPVVNTRVIVPIGGVGGRYTGLRCALEVPGKKGNLVSAQVMGLYRHGKWSDESWVKLDV